MESSGLCLFAIQHKQKTCKLSAIKCLCQTSCAPLDDPWAALCLFSLVVPALHRSNAMVNHHALVFVLQVMTVEQVDLIAFIYA